VPHNQPRVVVVMGVSGSGKTTVGLELAEALGWRFQEGDALHPAANVEKMRHAIPLTDEDRWPWLAAIAGVIDGWRAKRECGVLTCSALKQAYRDAGFERVEGGWRLANATRTSIPVPGWLKIEAGARSFADTGAPADAAPRVPAQEAKVAHV